MLDLSTVKITMLISEYIRNNIIFAVAIFLIALIIYLYYKNSYAEPIKKSFICSVLGLSLLLIIVCQVFSFNYCEVAVSVIPTEKLTIEQIQQSDKFIEKDGNYYYVKRLTKPLSMSKDSFFKNMNRYIKYVEYDFNRDLDFIYYKSKIINK